MDRPCTGTRSGPSPCASGPGAPYLGLSQPAYANFAPQFPHSSAVDSRRSSHSGHLNMPPSIFFRICARMIRTARSRKLLGCWARSRSTGSTSKPFSRHASIWRVYSSSSIGSGPSSIPSIAFRISRRTVSGIDRKSGSSERTSSEPRTPARVFSMYACSASGPRAAPHAGHVVSDSGTTARHARHRVRSCRFGAAGATLCRRILREIVWWRPRRTADSGSASLITSAKSRKPRSVRRRAVRWSIPGTRANAFTASSSASSRSLLTPAPHASHTAIRLENIFPHFGQIAWPGRRIVAHRGHTAASDAKPQTGHFPGIGPVHPGPPYLTVPPRLSRASTIRISRTRVEDADGIAEAFKRGPGAQPASDPDWVRPGRQECDDRRTVELHPSFLDAVPVVVRDVAAWVGHESVAGIEDGGERVVQTDRRRVDVPRIVSCGQLDVRGDPLPPALRVEGVRIKVDCGREDRDLRQVLDAIPGGARVHSRNLLRLDPSPVQA